MKNNEKIRVFLADDHTIFREGLRSLIEDEPDLKVVGESSNGTELLQHIEATSPDVIIMDITMPELDGIETTRRLKLTHLNIHVLILSMSDDEEDVERAIEAGVSGYLVKQTVASDLLNAIREVKRGNVFFSPSISKVLLERKRAARRIESTIGLTLREQEILKLIARSKTNKDIALLLNISPKTVDKHRGQIMSKLDIHDIAGLTRYAISIGLITQP